jgi:hypothetical protein
LRVLRRLAALSWAGWVLALVSLWLQYHLGVYHTRAWLWLPTAMMGCLAGVTALLLGVGGALLGPRRRTMLGWGFVGMTPLLPAAVLVGYMLYEQGRRNLPNTQAHKIGRMAAITLLEWHAKLAYPHRLETGRLVMYYDDFVRKPGADAAAMEAHLAHLEEVLGRRQHARIIWVRGPSLGMARMSIHSIALGSDTSPAHELDRHELAHALMYQFSRPGAEPPMLLLEGWAMAVDKHPEPLAAAALACRCAIGADRPESSCLRRILSPESYHRGTSYAYDVGGAFVDYLIRQHGVDRFVAFYNSIHPDNYESICEGVFGCSFDALEREFWKDAESRSKHGK